jgi:pimeloyl-ACP methyl ester carboxylesterase
MTSIVRLALKGLPSDAVALLQHLDVPQVDAFGSSVGRAGALYPAIRHSELIRKAIISRCRSIRTATAQRTPRRCERKSR